MPVLFVAVWSQKTSDLAKSLGSSIREFKNATKELDDIS
ncbi:hypothetical protein GF406_26460 [candidate division KSB1 bacterium]|nr:hypothetical protein [candidate division KSB1 bacterium]